MTRSKNKGRQKVEMVKMQNDSNLQVTFSKRRSGLFKKASELCTLCGAEALLVVFSPGKKVFSFGHPGVEALMERFFGGSPPPNSCGMQLIETHRNANLRELSMQLTQATNQLEAERKHGEELTQMRKASPNWWEAPVDQLNLTQLQQLRQALEELKHNVARRAQELLIQSTSQLQPPPPPMPPQQRQQFHMGSSSTSPGVLPYDPNMNMANNGGFNPNMNISNNPNMNMANNGGFGPNMNMSNNVGFNSNMNMADNEGFNPNMNMNHMLPPQGFNPGFGHGFFQNQV